MNVILVLLLKSEAPLTEKSQCGLNVASEVRRSCKKIIDIIKVEATLRLCCGFGSYGYCSI